MSAIEPTKKGVIKQVAEAIFGLEARLAARWAYGAHKRLMQAQWSLRPSPEWFDHQIDIYYQFQKDRNSLWYERGAFGSLALKHGNLLELACGDGFNAKNCYSLRSERVVACDFDPTALATVHLKNSAPNVEYILADIRSQMRKEPSKISSGTRQSSTSRPRRSPASWRTSSSALQLTECYQVTQSLREQMA